jgi:outer membrane protein assembly factor BamA
MRRTHAVLACALALSLGGAVVRPAAAARLSLRGWPGPVAVAEGMLQGAMRIPRDSLSLASGLARLSASLQGDGWLDARVAARWNDDRDPLLDVTVAPGVRYRWESVVIDASPADSAVFGVSFAALRGAPASPAALADAIVAAVDAAESAGYAWASLGVSAWEADSGRVRARLTGALGPRVRVAEVLVEGLVVTRPEVAEKAMGRLRGLAYNPASARFATRRLEELGIFRRVEYVGIAARGDWREGVLHWRVEEPRYNTFEGAVGVQGAAGVVGLARLELGNLLGTARSMTLSWQSRGRGLTDFGARYVEPMLFGRALRWEGALQQQIQDTVFTRFRWGTRARVALGGRLRAEAGYEQERVVQARAEVRDADAQNTSFALERDGRDEVRSPRRGTRTRLEVTQVFTHETLHPQPGLPPAGRDVSGSALQLEGEWHRPVGRSAGLALETRAAGRFGSQRVLGEWQRWAVGGSASLRGHDEEEYRVDRYALTRLEWRFFLGAPGQRAALFWDHAHMETRRALAGGGDRLERREAEGLGVGLRLPAAGGDVDIDYGISPGHGVLEGKIHLRLVTAF